MSCVTKNSKEFKDAVRRLDVHPDNLEVVLHKFLNTEGREDIFPTDAEIMGELRAKPFEATDAEVKFYLGAEHQGQKKFGNLADATHQLEVFKDLYSGTPTMYRDSMGNYIVEAGIPMLKGIPINMGIPFTMDNTTIDQVLQTLDSNNAHHNTLRALIDALGKENIHISMGIIKKKDTTMKNMKGKWGDPIAVHGVNGIKFDPFTYRKYLDSTFKPEDTVGRESDFRRVLLHELTHQLSSKVLRSDEANLNPEELKFKREVERLYKIAKESTNYEFYGLENVEEFVAEAFSNNGFRRYLNSIKDNSNTTLWSKFINAIGKFLRKFGLKVPIKHSVLSSIVATTTEFRDFHKAEREKQQAEIKLQDEVIEQELMEASSDDLFSPSNEGFYSLKNKFDRDADGYREGQYSFESRRYYNKEGTYMVFNIPTYRVSLDESITKGYEMLEKLGFDTEDFDLKGPVKESRDGGQYLNVKVRPLVERQARKAKREKLALEEKETRDAYENYRLSQLTDRERILNSFNQSERDFIDRIEQTDPELAKQVLDGMITIEEADELIRDGELNYSMSKSVQWGRTAPNSYEVSTQGDSRFSALKAKFKPGTIIDGVDVGGMTIENVYQSVIKKSGKGKAPSRNSKLFVDTTPKLKGKMSFAFGNQRANGVTATTTLEAIKRGERTATTRYTSDGNIDYWKQAKVGDVIEFSDQNGEKVLVRVTKELHQLPKSTTAEEWSSKEGWDTSRFEQRVKPQIDKGEAYQMEFEYIDQSKEAMEDFSYREGYLPLWQEWARQNPELMQELREKSSGKVLTDKFANTRVSQARALAEILNSDSTTTPTDEISIDSLISKLDPSDKLGNIVLSRAKDLGIKVKRVYIESDRIESGISGQFKADESTIYINPDNMQENTLVHEAIHSITSYYFNAKRESLPKEIQIALQEIEYCHELLKQDFIEEHFCENGKLKEGVNLEKAFAFWIDNDSYGLTSPEEMIAEIGKPTFLNRIRKYDAKHKGDKSIFTKLVNAIVKLFSNSKEYSSVEKTIKDAMMTLFNTPNKELFSKHSNEIRTIKENYKTLRSVDKNVITIFPAPKVAEMIESSIGDEMREYTITLDPYTIDGMFRPEGARNFLTKPAPNTIIEVQVGKAKGLLVLTKPAEVISKEEGAKITVVPLDANYLKTHKLEVKVDNNVAHLVNFTLEYDISEIINSDGSINFSRLEEISDKYFQSADENLFKKGRKTLRTRKEHHIGENNTLEHLQNVVKTASTMNIRADLRPTLVLAAALHDLGKPFHGGQLHGFDSLNIINKIFKGNISDLIKFAVKHHMLALDETKGFQQEDANRIVKEAVDNRLDVNDAIEVLLALNTADIIRGRELTEIDQYSGKSLRETIDTEIPLKRRMLESAVASLTSGIPITESTDFKLQRFSAEFEGASNNLVGIVPEPLLSKVEDYIMSGGEIGLSEADAQQFLNYAETAYPEQETTNQEQQPIKKENQTYMERAITITQQIDNLNNSTALSATEVRHIAEQAVYWISDHITEIQETPGLAEKIYGEQFKDKDFASMPRADVVKTIGPDAMIAMCKEKFSPENTDYENFDTIEKAEVITDNWEAIMMLASDVFLGVEEFSIVSSKDGKTREVNTDLVADADNFNSSNMENDVLENEGDLQEHWQVETKTLDVLATMSQMVRQALTKCYLLDKDGNNITSEFGINERINVREATNSILRWTQGALNLEQVIAKLQEKADSNPWVRQIIDRLSDKSGKEADFQSQFFGICKPFQSYSVVIEENGKYKSIPVNENPALSEAMTQVTTQYKIGEHPLFTTEGINKGAFKELKSAFEELSKYNHQGYDLTNIETRDEAARTLGYISNLLGYYVTPEMVADNLNKDTFKRMFSALRYITNSLERNLDNNTYEPFKFGSKDGINGNTREFLKPITDHLEDIAVSAFYDSGKMYQSYITPSYTTKLFQKFGQTGQAFDDFIMDEYGNMPWFHTGTNIERGWRNSWLKSLATDSKAREIFKHKVQLNFNKHNYMKNMSDMEYTLSILTEYFSESASEKQTRVPAWFRVPMLSNKPSSEFIRFYSERGANYRDSLTNGFKMIFDQELSRIQTVEMRNFSKDDPRFINNFDTNGKKFMFLDFMNEYLTGNKKSSELGKLIRQKLDGKKIDEARLNELVKDDIMETMNARADAVVASWETQGILKGAEKVANIGTTEEEIRENLKNFVWNDTFAAMNIMQLTITDIAFYKDAEDLQKRLAQIHAPGVRGNVRATDYEGRSVTDGKFRTIKFTDFDTFTSNIIDNVSVVFDRKIASAPESEKAALRALKESLVGEKGAFRQINVADAQGYSSPTSYRKKAFIFGKWSRKAEEVYQKLREGTYTYSDLQVAFQPLKPFVYSQIIKDVGVDGAPLDKLKVPVQYKNSEYLLIMADALLQGEDTGKPNLLRAIFEVMEESHFDKDGNYKTDGIDTAQFESTVKSGLMGRINLNDLVNDPNGESIAKARMEAAIYEATAKEVKETNSETGVEETKTIYERTGAYNNSAVDVVPFEDYCLQQEVPEHFKEHEQAHGSQLRYIIVSELENFNYLGEPVTYNLEGKQVTAQEFKAEYENTIAENIQESIDELAEELSLNDLGSIKDRNIALSKILQREILSSPRYGVDLLQACSVDENGRFRIPLGDPIQSKRVEQLINSIIKNRINKQKIAGGPVVQVTNFGTSKELNIRFKDKSGNLLMTRAEYEKNPIKKEISQTDKFNARYKRGGAQASTNNTMSYEDYIKENQAGIAYFEVFAPIYSNQLFNQFADKNGVINIQALEMLDPDLLKMIGYRIPTEDKYSMAPLKIVGFLPREAGDGIMLPNDITLLTGSDFDVDKEYLMRKEYNIIRSKTTRSEIHKILYDELVNSQKGKLTYKLKSQLRDLIEQFLDDPFDSASLTNQKTAKGYISMPKGAYNKMLRTYMQNMYTVNKPTEGRTYRNNKIVDMTYEVLTHETSAYKMLNPGGFDPQKRMGYLVSAYKQNSYKYTWEQLQGMTISQLKDLNNSNKNLSYIDTHIQFYKQNSAAGALIGIFAVNRIAHAVLESGSADGSSTYKMNVDNVCKITRNFTVAGMEFGGLMPFDMRYDRNGQLIGKVMGSLVASAADAVKDPVLNLMNINSNTANILNTLVRFGMPFENAALFLSQSVISYVLADFSKENITGYKSLSKVIQDRLNKIKEETNIDESSEINKEELTLEELVEGLKPNVKPEIAYKTLVAFSNFQKMAEAMRMPTFATRFNSMSSAVGPLIIDNLITEYKMQKLSLESNIVDAEDNLVDMSNIFLNHPILSQFQKTVGIAKQLFGNMPANSTGFRNILDLVNESPLSNVILGDRKILSSLSDFYQSYLVMKNRVVNPNELGYFITEFPKEFMEKEYKKKYADNALIQAIKYGTDKSGRATLQVDITGLDTQQKEKYSSAWIDLHKVDPDLSIKLFNYNFFRGGIGFSPKTFMSLVPVYVKERIPGYVDTFRVLPSIVPETVLDQFIRNNWDNNRLVPRKKVTLKHLPNGHVEVFKPSEIKELTGVQYFKTKVNNEDKLFMQILEMDGAIEYKEITPLGSNKEYLEMSESTIDSPLNIPTEAKVETTEAETSKQSELAETEVSAEAEETETATTDEAKLNDLLYKILVIEGVRNEEQAGEYIRNYKTKSEVEKAKMEKQFKKFFETRFKKLNIEFNSKLIDDIYKLIC